MAILSERDEFCDTTALNTSGVGSFLLGDVIDLGTDGINDVEGIKLVIVVDTAAASAGAATGAFHLVSDAQAAIATDGSATYHWSSPAIPVATLAARYPIVEMELPKGQYERYLGVIQTTGAFALTAGAISAFLTTEANTWKAFPDAAGVSI